MKNSMIIFAFLVICAGTSFSQSYKPYPIPSFAVPVDSLALFVESGGNTTDQSKARKDGYVKVYTNRPENPSCGASIFWYSLDGIDTLGPFSVSCGETLITSIDERAWGVLVVTEDEVLVDVWIE
jgi:hypothetical protein